MGIFLLWFMGLRFLALATAEILDDTKPVTKCCQIDENLEIINKKVTCFSSYTHAGHWESFNVNVHMKKGNIILETDNIHLSIKTNGNLKFFDGKETIIYDDYCVDHNEDDVYLAIVQKNSIADINNDVPAIRPIVKCCPLEHSVEQQNQFLSCVTSYTHSAHWEYEDVVVSMKKGHIIKESDAVRIRTLQNGTVQVTDDDANTISFYDEYCVDHNQNDTFIAVVRDRVPKSIRKCCALEEQAYRLKYTITQCFTTNGHLAFWEKYNTTIFNYLRKGHIIEETDFKRFHILNHGVLRVTDSYLKEDKDYSIYCMDFDQEDKFIAVVKEYDHHSFYSIWPEQIVDNLSALPLTVYIFFHFLSFLCVIATGSLCIWLSALIPYGNRASCLGYLGICLSIGLVTDGFWMSSIFRNISNLCYLIAYGWMTVVWIIVNWRSQYQEEIQFRQFLYLFFGVPFLSCIFLALKCFNCTPCFPFCGGHSSELLSCFGIHISIYLLIDLGLMVYTSITLSKVLKKERREELDSDFRDFLGNYKKARKATIIVMICWIIELIELAHDTYKFSYGLLNVLRGFAVGMVGYLAYRRLFAVLKQNRTRGNEGIESGSELKILDGSNSQSSTM